MLHLREGRDIEAKKKAKQPAGFEPTTSLLHGVCSTAVLQPLPIQKLGKKRTFCGFAFQSKKRQMSRLFCKRKKSYLLIGNEKRPF